MTAEGRTGSTSPLGRLWQSSWRLGLAVPLIAGLVLVVLIVIAATTGRGFPNPEAREAGDIDSYITGLPKYVETEHFWTVTTESGEALAFSDKDPSTRCIVLWRNDLVYQGKTGWFQEACSDGLYDYTGQCFTGACTRNLDRYATSIEDGEIIVNLKLWSPGAVPDPNRGPLNPPSLND